MKEILIPLNFTPNPVVYDTEQSFSTADASSAVLAFSTTEPLSGVVASLTIKNISQNANLTTVLIDRIEVSTSPFRYTFVKPLASGDYYGEIILKRNLEAIGSAQFTFGVNSSLAAEVLPHLIQAYSLDDLVEQVEAEINNLKAAYNLNVESAEDRISTKETTITGKESIRSLNETQRKANELTRIAQELSRVAAEEERQETFDTLVDSGVIDQVVVQEVAEKYIELETTYSPRLLSAEQQLEHIETTKADLADLPSSAYVFKSSTTFAALPTTGNTLGDVYFATDTVNNYAWTGTAWTPIGNGAFANGSVTTAKVADGAVTAVKTDFLTVSENIINPANVLINKYLSYTYGVSTINDYTDSTVKSAYSEVFPAVIGDIIYSNVPGRLVCYNASGVSNGNVAFSLDVTLGLYKATVVSGTQSKIDGTTANITAAGYWFACKSVNYSGTPSPYNYRKLDTDIDSSTFAKQTGLDGVSSRVTTLEDTAINATFFVPKNLFCYTSNVADKRIKRYNVMATKNNDDFYIDTTALKPYLRGNDDIGTQTTDVVSIKKTLNNATVYSKTYTRLAADPTTKSNPLSAKNVLIIGDSYSDNGYIPTDIKKQITVDNGFTNFNFIGTKSDTFNGVTALNEGRGGYTIDDFTKTDNADGRGATYPNPFLSSGVVNFNTYMTNNSFGNLDYVILELGVNNLVALGDDEAVIKTKMQSLIDLILASYPSCKIFVVGLVMASKISGVEYAYHNAKALKVNKSFEDLCTTYVANCVYVDTGVFFDTEYGFMYEFISYRGSTEQRKRQTDWLHPAEAGYYMMADTISSAFIYYM